MELRESIESINYKLDREFGRAFNNSPNFRIVFSEDQYEMRKTYHTDEGLDLIHPEVRQLPKYNQWIKQRYILERLIPIVGDTDLMVEINYEPCWTFQDRHGNYLPPWFDGCKFVIEALYSQINSSQKLHAKYKDPLATTESKEKQLQAMIVDLFGNETATGDALAYGSGISLSTSSEAITETAETAKIEGIE